MPRLDGTRLAEELKKRWPTIAILFMTGWTATEAARASLMAGDYLSKPFLGGDLLRQVRALLDRRRGAAADVTTG